MTQLQQGRMSSKKAAGGQRKNFDAQMPSDDEVDAFHKSKDRLALNVSDDDESESESEDGGDLEDDLLGSSDDDESESDDDDEDGDGRLAQLAKTEKIMRRKVALQQAADSSDDGDAFDEEDEEGGWGAAKRSYYADDGTADKKKKKASGMNKKAAELEEEDAREADEREAARLQREAAARLRASDFALAGEEESSDEDEGEGEGATLGKQPKQKNKGKGKATAVQALPRARATGQGSAGAAAAASAAAAADAPALAALLSEMRESLASASRVAGPLLADLREGESGGSGGSSGSGLATRGGLSFLEAKNVLLLQYSSLLAFYVALVAEGGSPADHPVVRRLVQARAFLEKARPIDKRLRPQVERLLAAASNAAAAARSAGGSGSGGRPVAAAGAGGGGDDDLAFAPRPGALLPRSGASAAATGDNDATNDNNDGIYRPPRLSAASMGGAANNSDPTSTVLDPDDPRAASAARKAAREAQHQRSRAARSGFVRELAAELAGAPEELDDIGGGASAGAGHGASDGAAALRAKQALAARASEEETLMTRVALSKDERKRLLSASRYSGLAGGALLDELTEDVAGLVGSENPAAPGLKGFDAHTVAQRYGGGAGGALGSGPSSSSAAAAAARSGDALPPSRPGLAERRAAVDASKAHAALKRSRQEEEDLNDSGPEEDYDDGEYLAVAARSRASKAARKAAFAAPSPHVPLARSDADGPRAISRDVEKNRGLTPHRRKDIKNPRVKGRKRFEKATVRRRGQVRDVAAGAAGAGYGGEKTGVRSKLSKSVRFG